MKTRTGILLIMLSMIVGYGPALADETGVYGYFRILDGSATLIQVDTGVREEAEINQPILEGDTLWIAPRARLEVVLSDGGRLRGAGGTELIFQQFNMTEDRSAVLQLNSGDVQWVLPEDPNPESAPRIDTGNATIYLHSAGAYRVSSEDGQTRIVVREGYAEVLTPRGSTIVRAGEQVRIDGYEQASIQVVEAPGLDSLERWGAELESPRNESESARYVGGQLGYSAAVLDDYGSWIVLGGQRAWRPRVSVSWRPYWNGRWSPGSMGMTWISHEPWGWVPHHYGSWDYWSGYGWVWYPGHVYSPASVHWYWGSGYAGWVPSGYYGRYYGWDLRIGLYGWAGGSWDHYDRWTFCSTSYLGRREQYGHYRTGHGMRGENGSAHIGRGLITNDTRGIKPASWHDPEEVLASLRGNRNRDNGDLPDVTDFVSRKRDLDPMVRERVRPTDNSPRQAQPEIEQKAPRRDQGRIAKIEPKAPTQRPSARTDLDWRGVSTGFDDRRSNWRSTDNGKLAKGIDTRIQAPGMIEPRDRPIGTHDAPRPDGRADTTNRITSQPRDDLGRQADMRPVERFRVEPRFEAPRDEATDRQREAADRGKVVDSVSREKENALRATDDWRNADRDRTQRDKSASSGVDRKEIRSFQDVQATERFIRGEGSSRDWRATDTRSGETPVVRRVLDSIRSTNESYSSRPSNVDSRNSNDSSPSRSTRTERIPSRSETVYRPSSTSERRNNSTTSPSVSSRPGESSARGSEIKSPTTSSTSGSRSSSTRSSSARSSSASRSKSGKSSSKPKGGKG